nr:MAG TPA: hypothetical protein [Caudoviricetes sp.]
MAPLFFVFLLKMIFPKEDTLKAPQPIRTAQHEKHKTLLVG